MSGYDIDAIEPGTDSGGGGGGGGDGAWTTGQINTLLANTAPVWGQTEIDELLANTAAAAAGVALTETALADDTAYADTDLYGWSIENTSVDLTTVYIRLGANGSASPFIAINLAADETVTQIFEHPISNASGFFVTVEAGSATGILYTD